MTSLYKILRGGWNTVLDLFYPPLCYSCGRVLPSSDDCLCADCYKALSFTEHAFMRGNKVELLFHDQRKFVRGGAWCFYEDDSVIRTLIHQLKYHHCPLVGEWLGREAAKTFRTSNPRFFEDIDVIIPVPLHKKKLRERGYNQAELIAFAMGRELGIEVDTTHLVREVDNPTQTHLTAEQRKTNTEHIFALRPGHHLMGKHVLLVDDIVTTGSTMRDCMRCLSPLRNTRFSVFAIATAGQ